MQLHEIHMLHFTKISMFTLLAFQNATCETDWIDTKALGLMSATLAPTLPGRSFRFLQRSFRSLQNPFWFCNTCAEFLPSSAVKNPSLSSILVSRLVKSNGQVMCQCRWEKNVFIKSRIGAVGSGRPNALSGFESQNCKRRYLRKEQVENIIFESHPYPKHPT